MMTFQSYNILYNMSHWINRCVRCVCVCVMPMLCGVQKWKNWFLCYIWLRMNLFIHVNEHNTIKKNTHTKPIDDRNSDEEEKTERKREENSCIAVAETNRIAKNKTTQTCCWYSCCCCLFVLCFFNRIHLQRERERKRTVHDGDIDNNDDGEWQKFGILNNAIIHFYISACATSMQYYRPDINALYIYTFIYMWALSIHGADCILQIMHLYGCVVVVLRPSIFAHCTFTIYWFVCICWLGWDAVNSWIANYMPSIECDCGHIRHCHSA